MSRTSAELAAHVQTMSIAHLLLAALVRLDAGDRDIAETLAAVAVEKMAIERLRKQ